MGFRILCDSCTDLTPELEADHRIIRVPLTIRVNRHTFIDDHTLVRPSLLRHMKASEDAPSTACPSVGDYMRRFSSDPDADDIYIVTLSALLSGSFNAAGQAIRLFREEGGIKNLHAFNSRSASAGQVNIVMHLRELAEHGTAFKDVVTSCEQYIREMKTLFVLETLDNLRKNGRLSRMQAAVAGAAHIKLLCGSTEEGEIRKLSQAFSIKQALVKLTSMIEKDESHWGRRLVISHCNCPERAQRLKEAIAAKCHFREIIITEAGGVTSVYADDGGIVIAY